MKVAFSDERKVVLAREVTKRFEEFIRGTIDEVLEWLNHERYPWRICHHIVEGNETIDDEENPWNNWTLKDDVESVMANERRYPVKKQSRNSHLLEKYLNG